MVQPHDAPEPQELNELRRLLLLPEQDRLEDLETRFMEPDILADYMKEALPRAVRLAGKDGVAFSGALKPVVEEIMEKSVRQNPGFMIEVLFPIIGTAVRKSVKETFERTLQAINQTMETRFSRRSLQWRFEAWRTGKPYSDIVLYNTLIYRVEQVFLVHKETGALLCHCTSDLKAMADGDLVGSMLTAIESFVKDSFQVDEGAPLQSMRVGDLDVWLEAGPHAYLALAIRGNVPMSLRQVMVRVLEDVHHQYADELEAFRGDVEPFRACYGLLNLCMRSRRKAPASPKGTLYALGLILLAASVYFGAKHLEHTYNAHLLRRALTDRPGLVVTDIVPTEKGFRVLGLRDPDAVDLLPAARGEGYAGPLEDAMRPYYATDPEMLLRRTRRLLTPLPPDVSLSMRDGDVVVLTGHGPAAFARRAETLTPPLGVRRIDTSDLRVGAPKKTVTAPAAPPPKPVVPDAETLPTKLPDIMDWLALKNLTFAFEDEALAEEETAELEKVARVLNAGFAAAERENRVLKVSLQAMVPVDNIRSKVQGYTRAQVVKRELESLGVPKGRLDIQPVVFQEVVAETAAPRGVLIFGVSLSESEAAP